MDEVSQAKRIQPVDIRKIFYKKNPGMARMIPGFAYRYLEKIVHQDDINAILAKHGEKKGLDFARAAIGDFGMSVKIQGDVNLPREGRYIFASNHPLGGFDGILLMDVLGRYYSDFKILANDLIMNIVNLHPLLVPINKHGKQATEAARELDEVFRSDMQIVTFPAGLVSRYIKGEVMDLVWHKNFITKAIYYKRDVIPVYFTGKNSTFFYTLAKIRKFLRIKANLEMFYLVDETFRHRNETLTVTFGKPIPYSNFDRSKTHLQWAKWVKEQVYKLGGLHHVPL